MGVDKSYGSGKAKAPKKTTYTDSYIDRGRAATASMGPKAKAVRAEQNRVANIVASKVGEAIGFVTNGPEHTQGYNQLGVLGSKGFVQAAAKVAGMATRRAAIQEVKHTMAARAGYSSPVEGFKKMPGSQNSIGKQLVTGITSPKEYAEDLMNMAHWSGKYAAHDLASTIGPRSAYTALKADAANMGRQLAKDVSKVNYAIDKYGGEVARKQIIKWAQGKEKAQAFAEQARRLASKAPKGTSKQAK
jgi:hypothetical protein